jgi:hypothetical protein
MDRNPYLLPPKPSLLVRRLLWCLSLRDQSYKDSSGFREGPIWAFVEWHSST